MKKYLIPLILTFLLLITACSSKPNNNRKETFIYQSKYGAIEVPKNPERIVVLSSFNAGSVMALEGNIVGADSWVMNNENYQPYLKNAVVVSDDNLEKIVELNPDLIIATNTNNNLDRLKQIAPTVIFVYGDYDYLTTHIEIGKLLNKEKEAKDWVEDFKKRAENLGKEVKAKYGEDITVSVFENFNKQLYVFGDNWGRGTEILYQEMKLNMPEKVKEMALTDGYYALSLEVLPEYAGDFIIISSDGVDNSFQETETYQNIPAVKNNRVFLAQASVFYFNDPITLKYQLQFFQTNFLGE